jgi:Domain of unknown function (DUF309)
VSRKTRPTFWSRQDRLPLEVNHFLQIRLEAALAEPRKRTVFAWLAILGAPVQREAHPLGIPEPRLLALAERMVKAVGDREPSTAWAQDRECFPDTALPGRSGWMPHALWEPFASRVSLRSGVSLLALTGQPEDDHYLLACGVALFNHALFHECHDALERLWRRSEGELKQGLQGLILLACGYYHQQHHNLAGMRSIWKDGIPHLRPFQGTLDTPWGRIAFAESLAMASQRLEWLQHTSTDEDWLRFWETPSPEWEFV